MELFFRISFIAILIFAQVGLGLNLLLRVKINKTSFYFAALCFSLAFWSLASFMLKNALNSATVDFWGRHIHVGPILIAYFFLLFTMVFPKEDSKDRPLLLALPTVFFLLLVPSSLILDKGTLTAAGPVAVWGPAYPLFALYFLGYFLWGVFNLFHNYLKTKGNEKNQIRYVFLGLFLSFFFGIIFNLVFPALGISQFLDFGPYFALLLIAFTAYAITKHRLMDISVVISRLMAEILTIFSLGAIYLVLTWFHFRNIFREIDWLFLVWTIAYGIVVGETFGQIRLFFQTTSDKVFLRGKYNYYRELSDASAQVGRKLSLPDILKVLYNTFADVVEVANPRIFLPEHFSNPEKSFNRYLPYSKDNCSPLKNRGEISVESLLIKKLLGKREAIVDVKELSAALVVPCFIEDRLVALFALGPKLSEEPYTDEDLRLLTVLANQVAITLDHTRAYEKIKIDLEATERQLERSQRLASLGTLTAGVTHEIRNPLTLIRAETERLPALPRDQEYLKEHSALLIRYIDRITGIVQRILSLAKEKPKQQNEVDLRELIISTIKLFTISGIKLTEELQPIPPIKGDAEELQEVFVNLIQNAIEAMSKGGTLTVKTYQEDHRVVAEITDTGKGIPEELREKIFDPFFSTRHEGTGLGLSIVYRIIREHGGDIKLTSEVGQGTTFKVLF